jgi:hypothetical protein
MDETVSNNYSFLINGISYHTFHAKEKIFKCNKYFFGLPSFLINTLESQSKVCCKLWCNNQLDKAVGHSTRLLNRRLCMKDFNLF